MRIKLHDAVARFEQAIRLTNSAESVRYYSRLLNTFQVKFPEKTYVDEFFRIDIQDFRTMRWRDHIAKTTIHKEIGVLSSFWAWMVDRGLALYNPCTKLAPRRTKEEPKNPKAGLPREVLAQLFKSGCRSIYDKLFLVLAITTGMSAHELGELTLAHFDNVGQLVSIPGTDSSLPLRADAKLFLGMLPSKGSEQRVFAVNPRSSYRYGIGANYIRSRWKLLLRRAGIQDYPFPSLGRTFANLMIRAGAEYEVIRVLETRQDLLTPAQVESLRAPQLQLPKFEDTKPRLQ